MLCNKLTRVAIMAGLLTVGLAGGAGAFLDTGTLLTNSASATYRVGTQASSVSYSATAKILVANPAVFLWKEATPTCVSASAGGTIEFTVCFSNGGANTAWNITIKDKLPHATLAGWVAGSYSGWWVDLTGTKQSNPTMGYNTAGSLNGPWVSVPPNAEPANGQDNLVLLWWIPSLGIGKSGCVTFKVSIG